MNCAQHPGTAAAAYCRSCGRALCELCRRDVQGAIFCGPCLAAPGSVAPKEHENSPVGAVLLIALGVLFMLSNLGWFSFHWVGHYWPAILIAAGLYLFLGRRRGAR